MAPFVGYAHLRTHRDGFAESGNGAALTLASSTRNLDVLQTGVAVSGVAPLGLRHSCLVVVSYQHNWGNSVGIEHATFVGNGIGSTVEGARTGRQALRLEGGGDVRIGKAFRIGAGAFGQTSGSLGEYGAKASIGYVF